MKKLWNILGLGGSKKPRPTPDYRPLPDFAAASVVRQLAQGYQTEIEAEAERQRVLRNQNNIRTWELVTHHTIELAIKAGRMGAIVTLNFPVHDGLIDKLNRAGYQTGYHAPGHTDSDVYRLVVSWEDRQRDMTKSWTNFRAYYRNPTEPQPKTRRNSDY